MIPHPPRSTPSIRRRQRQMCIRDRSDGGQSRTNAVRNDQADFAASQGGPREGGQRSGCLLYTSPSPRDGKPDLVCRRLLEKKKPQTSIHAYH
ncbi:hypothetical protein FRIG_15745 [Frigoribacterium faeni]|uniref:hypothetical protein n=1 Tax=Frigoribacterium faeni TaxID=145483 RepID=UPI001FAC5271|nr:hypothetical protein [Frigoribacterium faeni]MCJ0702564.1 hypothetical protein [Frigoribacterium faeni]